MKNVNQAVIFTVEIMNQKLSKFYNTLLIDFNGMSTHIGLFYALRLGNCVHYTFIFKFFV